MLSSLTFPKKTGKKENKNQAPGYNFKSCKCLDFECLIDYIDASLHLVKLPEAKKCLYHCYQNTRFENWSTFLGKFSEAQSENGLSPFPEARISEERERSLCSEPSEDTR